MNRKRAIKHPISEPVSIVAHQLKGPLSVIKGYLEVLSLEEIGKLNEQQKEYISDLLHNVERITKFVLDLLDVSRIEYNQYEISSRLVDLSKLTEEYIKDISQWAEASSAKINFRKPTESIMINADLVKIQQVIANFVSNAIIYKEPGDRHIEVTIQKDGNNALFICKDSGIGIPKKDLRKMFTKFYRSEKAFEIHPTGTGLGLYINKVFIEMSGGKVWCKKNKRRGTTFYFTVPLANT